ncbi:sensor histidine kinase [Streptomyces lydicus]|uniref:sensor histidine kinase n=1 Tax=Streptomyces lydicus TaxID=47763 RepID=UPI0037AC607C
MARGRLRIYLGAAPGVGKTYAMLEEGQRLRSLGADVVVGFVEPHGRRPTAAMAEGLETVPRRALLHRGASFTEMDLDAVLARRPQVALVDELAHSNVPGTRNTKRWQDVEELLGAGIDVVTTLNIQHLESLNDVVRQITGVRQRETLPDEVARRADQIELVDLPPEVLRRRMVHGDIYPPDRIESALTHYFRVGNLTALREIALLWLADRVEEGLQRYRAQHGISAPWETRERILVGLSGGPEGETLIRRAARISARTPGTELLGLHVVPEDGLTDVDPAALDAQRTLLESLGGSYHQTSGEDVVEALLQFAEAENVTQIVLGASRHGRLAAALRAGTGERTIKGSGPIDVHIVTHKEAAGAVAPRLPHPSRGTGPRRYWSALAGTVLLLPLLTLLLTALRSHLDLSSDLVIYLLAVVVVALIGGLYPALFAAVAAALLADYCFTMPVHSLAVERPNEIIALVVFLTTAALVGTAAGEAARRTHQAVRATSEARALSRLATAMMRGQELAALIEQIRENFGLTAVSLLERDPEASPEPRWYVVASAGERPPEKPYEADVESPVEENLTLAARGSGLSTEDRRVLAACAAELGLAHSRGRITGGAAGADTLAAAERTRASLLLAAGRDLQVPLHTADEALARLGDRRGGAPPQKTAHLLDTARAAVRRATQLVTDLDELSRLHAGALDLYLRPVDLDEALAAALDDLGPGGHTIVVRLPEQLPDVIADAALLTRVLTALGADALRHSPSDRPPVFTAEVLQSGRLEIRVADGPEELGPDPRATRAQEVSAGPRTAGTRADSLALRLSRDLVEAMGGTFETAAAGPAFVATLTLPSSSPGSGGTTPGSQA